MTKDEIKAVLKRVPTWPEDRQQALAEVALEIEAELAGTGLRGDAGRINSDRRRTRRGSCKRGRSQGRLPRLPAAIGSSNAQSVAGLAGMATAFEPTKYLTSLITAVNDGAKRCYGASGERDLRRTAQQWHRCADFGQSPKPAYTVRFLGNRRLRSRYGEQANAPSAR